MRLEVSQEDRDLLTRLLERTIGEMRAEVRRTREPGMHDELVAEEERMKALLAQLRALAEG